MNRNFLRRAAPSGFLALLLISSVPARADLLPGLYIDLSGSDITGSPVSFYVGAGPITDYAYTPVTLPTGFSSFTVTASLTDSATPVIQVQVQGTYVGGSAQKHLVVDVEDVNSSLAYASLGSITGAITVAASSTLHTVGADDVSNSIWLHNGTVSGLPLPTDGDHSIDIAGDINTPTTGPGCGSFVATYCPSSNPFNSAIDLPSATDQSRSASGYFPGQVTPNTVIDEISIQLASTNQADGPYSGTLDITSEVNAAVPEPSSVILFGTLLGITVFAFRRKFGTKS
jgi:hypothetical protein